MVTSEILLNGIKAKIQRADEHIKNLESEISSLLSSDLYRLVSEPNDDGTQSILRVVGPEEVPIRLSVIVGEIVHQLRSSLDHLVSALVVQNGNKPNKRHQYPICDTRELFNQACENGFLEGISDSAKTIIESRQPYSNGNNIKTHFLYVLREMNNADKHRLLNFIIAVGAAKELVIDPGRETNQGEPAEVIGISPPNPAQPTAKGAEVLRIFFGKPEPDMQIFGKPEMLVTLEDSGILPKKPIIKVSTAIRDKVVSIIQSLEAELK